jgi:transcriptional regulator
MDRDTASRMAARDRDAGFARERGFGALTVAPEGRPLVAHVPFHLSEDGRVAETHLPRADAVARAVTGPVEAVLVVSGPDGYVSPDWYGASADRIPGWHHVAVHLRGTLAPMGPEALRGHLDRIAALFEDTLAPKPPWQVRDMSPAAWDDVARAIVPFRLQVDEIEGRWQLGQDEPGAARAAAASRVAGAVLGQDLRLLAALMRGAGAPDVAAQNTVTPSEE